jgi:hypothetical protein
MNKEEFTPVSRRSDLILGLATICVFGLVALVASLERALVFSVVFGVFFSIVQTRWKSQNGRRFWLIIAILATIHVVVLSLIRFPEPSFGLAVLPFALVDGFAMWWLINWIERRFPSENRDEAR